MLLRIGKHTEEILILDRCLLNSRKTRENLNKDINRKKRGGNEGDLVRKRGRKARDGTSCQQTLTKTGLRIMLECFYLMSRQAERKKKGEMVIMQRVDNCQVTRNEVME